MKKYVIILSFFLLALTACGNQEKTEEKAEVEAADEVTTEEEAETDEKVPNSTDVPNANILE